MSTSHQTINLAGMTAWISGTVTSLGSTILTAQTPGMGVSASGQTVATGGVAVAIVGLLVQVINRVFEDRKADRDERRAIREHQADLARHDGELATLKEKLDQAQKDLADNRDKRHREAQEWNLKLLQLQLQVTNNTKALNTNDPTIRAAADKLGLTDAPTAGPIRPVVQPPEIAPGIPALIPIEDDQP